MTSAARLDPSPLSHTHLVEPALTAVASPTVDLIPAWGTADLVRQLNALDAPDAIDGRPADDSAEALRLYAADVASAASFYRQLACKMVRPYMGQAKQLQRAVGEHAPQNIVIVGGAGGMGAALAEHAAHRGATISLIDIPDAQGNPNPALLGLAELCAAKVGAAKVKIFSLYATDDAAMRQAMQQAAEFGGGAIDLLCHAAGIFGDKRAFELTAGHLGLRMEVNVRSTLVSVNAALPYLIRSKNPSYVFVSSMAATEFVGNQAEYCFTKHHQSASMDVLGHLLSHHLRIKVSELRFGHVFTPMCHGRGLDTMKMIQVSDVANLMWNIAKAPVEMRFKAVEVTPSERLEGEVIWPEEEAL
jgi:NAD(P)-dependent dehydrogenase (short-subunit alcohol dehydrogenase family)